MNYYRSFSPLALVMTFVFAVGCNSSRNIDEQDRLRRLCGDVCSDTGSGDNGENKTPYEIGELHEYYASVSQNFGAFLPVTMTMVYSTQKDMNHYALKTIYIDRQHQEALISNADGVPQKVGEIKCDANSEGCKNFIFTAPVKAIFSNETDLKEKFAVMNGGFSFEENGLHLELWDTTDNAAEKLLSKLTSSRLLVDPSVGGNSTYTLTADSDLPAGDVYWGTYKVGKDAYYSLRFPIFAPVPGFVQEKCGDSQKDDVLEIHCIYMNPTDRTSMKIKREIRSGPQK